MSQTLFDSSVLGSRQDSLEFITSVLQSPTEYSIVGNGLDAIILPAEAIVPCQTT